MIQKHFHVYKSGSMGGHVQTRCLSPYASSILATVGHTFESGRTNGCKVIKYASILLI